MESVTNHINYSVFDHNVNLLHKSFSVVVVVVIDWEEYCNEKDDV